MDSISDYITLIITGVGVIAFGWVGLLTGTNKLLKQQNEEYKISNAEMLIEIENLKKEIAKMQTRLDSIQDLPLQRIDETMKQMSTTLTQKAMHVEENNKMLKEIHEKIK